MKKKQANAVEVAERAGVSQSTVSRVFTPGASVSEKARRRVLEAAEELGYRPNALARGLITNKTNMVGLIMRDVQNPFYPDILDKFTRGLRRHGYHVLFVHTEQDEIQAEEITQFLEYSVEGIIVTDALLSSSVAAQFAEHHIPVLLFNRYVKHAPCSVVCCDNYAAGGQIGNYLLQQGHQAFAYIAGSSDTSTSRDREEGFRAALWQRGVEPAVEAGHYTYEGSYEAALKLLQDVRPDAIFCANDIMALGAIDAAKFLGLAVPHDVSIVGFDDIAMAAWPPYALTTWKQPVDEMIGASVEILLREIRQQDTEPVTLLLPGELVERNSASPFKKS
ncbi:LacI family DNA-binding transcriptional regulator [Ectobacillus ponti]|uniref:LacI family DNA-binding transcriptional regulator n=1 Tax=Ectobacillus ponti TaxID=2961894 RepID=A0AA41XC05_9BACI|nr:LacI family DNA-binding transcriptional regulator [Ectobacillus ponti]MCP8970893.1 LacI family DNA-binding transcriptional regulator [Ectobacillus ponti]